jgi:hypothetical protein
MAIADAPRATEMPGMGPPEIDTTVGGAKVNRRGNRAVVDFNPGASRTSQDDSSEHAANLVEELDEKDRRDLCNKIIEWVEVDLESRKDWQSRMDNAMELLGLHDIPGDEAVFEGASSVTYPMIGEAVVNFQSRAIEEIFPSDGPVKTKVVGEFTREKEDQSMRVQNHMNYQMLDQDKSYFWEVDQMLFYLPIGGSAFKKTYFCPVADMVVSKFIKSPDFIVPYIATSLQGSPRYTHRMFKNEGEMKRLFESGFYREIDLLPTTQYAKDSINDDHGYKDESDDRSAETHTDDHVYGIYECHCDLQLDFDQERFGKSSPLPYVVTVEPDTRELLSIRRNWKEDDQLFQKRLWFTHYRYLPGLGFYGFGLLHMIGSVAEATSASIRALLDAAAFANLQGGYVSSDVNLNEGDEHIDPGVYKQVNVPAEDLNKAFYTPPFKEPSQALAKLFELLLESGKSFSSSTEVMMGEASNTGPVGTTVALIEQGSKPFSAIHRRLHMAAAEEFSLRAELNFEFLPDQYPYQVENEEGVILRNDYDGRVDVIPISDPNVFSTTQRIAQAQAVVERSDQFPNLYNKMVVEERFLKAIRIPDYEELLAKNEPQRLDPVTENMRILQGDSATAFVEQDHDAHIQVHINFLNGLNEDALEIMGAAMQAHLAEHYAFKYFNEINRMAGGQMPAPGTFNEDQPMPPEVEQMIAQAAAQMPQIEIMPPTEGQDFEQEEFEREQMREDEKVIREQERKDQEFMADQERKDMEAVNKDDREQAMAESKQRREDRAAKAKEERENRAAEAKAKREERLARVKEKTAAKAKPAAK